MEICRKLLFNSYQISPPYNISSSEVYYTGVDMDYCAHMIVLYTTISDFRIYKFNCFSFHMLIGFPCEKKEQRIFLCCRCMYIEQVFLIVYFFLK